MSTHFSSSILGVTFGLEISLLILDRGYFLWNLSGWPWNSTCFCAQPPILSPPYKGHQHPAEPQETAQTSKDFEHPPPNL